MNFQSLFQTTPAPAVPPAATSDVAVLAAAFPALHTARAGVDGAVHPFDVDDDRTGYAGRSYISSRLPERFSVV